MNNITLNLIESEKKVKDITIKSNPEEIELLATLLSLYTNGFSLLGNLDNKTSDTNWLWLFLITRSFFNGTPESLPKKYINRTHPAI